MFSVYLYSLASVVVVSLISLVGAFFLLLSPQRLKNVVTFMVSLSVGTMLGDATIHLLPEMVKNSQGSPAVWLWLLAGLILFFLLEKIIHWHHCHNGEDCDHVKTIGRMSLIGDGLHNFIDGAIIAGSFLISLPLGFATTLAVVIHEIPQEFSDLGVLIHAGYSRNRALFLNFISALIAVLGAVIALSVSTLVENFTSYILPLTAGGFIYVAMADLIPELKKETSPRKTLEQLSGLFLGIIIMLLLKKLG